MLARFGFPTPPGPGACFTSEGDALFARGYPHLRIVTDEPCSNAEAQAEKALDAIDPVLRIRVPRALAEPYLRGYRVGPGLFVGPNARPENAQRRVERAEAIRAAVPIDRALLTATLEASIVGMGRDTYGRWRLPEVLYLYEHFIGSADVARALTDVLVSLANELSPWGFAGEDECRLNAPAHALALALPWILRRVPVSLANELRAKLAALAPKKKGKTNPVAYFALLRAISTPSAPLGEHVSTIELALAFAHDRPEPVTAALARQPRHVFSDTGRIVWLLGGAPLAGALAFQGLMVVPLLDRVSLLRDPGVVRLVAHIAAQRAGAKAASVWLNEHADHARPILEALARCGDAKEEKAANAALALLGGAKPAEAPSTPDELEAEIAKIFARLGERVRGTHDVEAQKQHIREAYEGYTEARSAAGDPIPEAYFTHRFGDFGVGQWAMLAVDTI